MSNRPIFTIGQFLDAERSIGSTQIHGIQAWLIGIEQPTLTEAQACVVLRFHLENTLRAASCILRAISECGVDASEILDSSPDDFEEWIRQQPDICLGRDLPKPVIHGGS